MSSSSPSGCEACAPEPAALTPEEEETRQRRIAEANERRERLEEARRRRMEREAELAVERLRLAAETEARRSRGMALVAALADQALPAPPPQQVEGDFMALLFCLSKVVPPDGGWPGVSELDAALRGGGGPVDDGTAALSKVHRHLMALARGGGAGRGSWVRELEEWASLEMGERSCFGQGARRLAYAKVDYGERVGLLHELAGAALAASQGNAEAESLRHAPVGRDAEGRGYWHVAVGGNNPWVAREEGEGMVLASWDTKGLAGVVRELAGRGEEALACELALEVYERAKEEEEGQERRGVMRRAGRGKAPNRLTE